MKKSEKIAMVLKTLLAAVFAAACYVLCELYLPDGKALLQKAAGGGILLCALGVVLFSCIQWERKLDCICALILFAGVVLRVYFMLTNPITKYSHDLDHLAPGANGHGGYLLRLIRLHALPPSYLGEGYQQPLYYLLSAAFSAGIRTLTGAKTAFALVSAGKAVSCAASCAVPFVTDSLCREAGVRGRGRVIALAMVSFLPSLILGCGVVSPDTLTTCLILLEVLVSLRLWKKSTAGRVLAAALVFGLGGMTSIFCWMVLPLPVVLFLKRMLSAGDNRQRIFGLCGKGLLFAAIALPLGLWYCVYGHLNFTLPFAYLPNGAFYTGGQYSYFARLFYVDFTALLRSPYVDYTTDWNGPVYWLKSSLFSEFGYYVPGFVSVLLLGFGIALALLSAYSVLRCVFRLRKPRKIRLLAAAALGFYGFMLLMAVRHPFNCYLDYRLSQHLTAVSGILCGWYAEQRSSQTLRDGWTVVLSGYALFAAALIILA